MLKKVITLFLGIFSLCQSILLSQNNQPILLKDIAKGGSSKANNIVAFKDKFYYFAQNETCEWTLFQTSFEKGEIPTALKIVENEDRRLIDIDWIVGENKLFFSYTDYKSTTLWETDGTSKGTLILRNFGRNEGVYVENTLKKVKNELFYFTQIKNDTVKLWSLKSATPIVVATSKDELNPRNTYVHDSLFFFVKKNRLWSVNGLKTKSLANFIPQLYDNGFFYGIYLAQNQQSAGSYEIATGKVTKYWNEPVNWHKFNTTILFDPQYPNTKGVFKIVGNQIESVYTDSTNYVWGQFRDKFYFNSKKTLWETDGTAANTKKYTGKLDIRNILSKTILNENEMYFLKDDNYSLTRFNITTNQSDTLIRNSFCSDFLLKNQNLFFIETSNLDWERKEIASIDLNTLKKTYFYQHNYKNKSAHLFSFINTEKYIYFKAADSSYYYPKNWQTDGTSQGTIPFFSNIQSDSLGLVIGQYKENICFFDDYNLYIVNEKTKKIVYKYQQNKGSWITPTLKNEMLYILEESNTDDKLSSKNLENNQEIVILDKAKYISEDIVATSKGVFFYAADTAYKYSLYFFDGVKTNQITTSRPNSLSIKDNKCIADKEGDLYFLNIEYLSSPDSNKITLWKTDGTNIGTVSLLGNNKLPFSNYDNKYSIYKTNKYLYLRYSNYPYEMTRISLIDGTIKIIKKPNTRFWVDAIYTTDDKFIFWSFSLWALDDAKEDAELLIDTGNRSISHETVIYQNKVYFIDYSYEERQGDLWVTDGTKLGTKRLFESTGGYASKAPSFLNRLADKLIFAYDVGCTGYELYSFTLPIVNNKEEYLNENPLLIFPNPTNGEVHIYNLAAETGSQINVLDLNGRILQQFTCHSSNYSIDLQGLQNGVYLIAVKSGHKTQNAKIVLLK